jgi:Rap1a immunity proteins
VVFKANLKHLGGNMRAAMVAAAVAVLATTPAVAEMTAKSMLERLERGDPAGRFFLMGTGNGLSWANAQLYTAHKPRLFCVPDKLALTSDQELDILKRYVREHPTFADMSVGAVLAEAMIDAFPCP